MIINNKKMKAMTLIEIIIAIALILILALVVLISIRPGERMAAARDSARERNLVSLHSAIYIYYIDNGYYPDNIPSFYNTGEINGSTQEICNTNQYTTEQCQEQDLLDFSKLVGKGYLPFIPTDPHGSNNEYGTGYYIAEGSLILHTQTGKAERKEYIVIGINLKDFLAHYNAPESEEESSCQEYVVDSRDGKTYSTVKIGNQCWMAEDLKYDCSLSGYNNIGAGTSWSGENNCGDVPEYNTVHYQWNVAMAGGELEGTQGLCPDGWIVPADSDFKQLELWLGMSEGDVDGSGWRGTNEGDKLKDAATGWCSELPHCGEIKFNAFPIGLRVNNGSLSSVGSYGNWWSSTATGSNAWFRYLAFDESGISRLSRSKLRGKAVRCLQDSLDI